MAAHQALQCAIALVVWQHFGCGRLGLSAVAEERGAHSDATNRSTAPGVIWVRNSVSIVSRLRRLRSRELIRRAAIVMEPLVLKRQLHACFPRCPGVTAHAGWRSPLAKVLKSRENFSFDPEADFHTVL